MLTLEMEMVPTLLCSFPLAKSRGSAPNEGGCIIISLSRAPHRTPHSFLSGPCGGLGRQWGPGVDKCLQYPAPPTEMPVRCQERGLGIKVAGLVMQIDVWLAGGTRTGWKGRG